METEEACLLKAGEKYGKCIDSCPVQALKEEEFDRCHNALQFPEPGSWKYTVKGAGSAINTDVKC